MEDFKLRAAGLRAVVICEVSGWSHEAAIGGVDFSSRWASPTKKTRKRTLAREHRRKQQCISANRMQLLSGRCSRIGIDVGWSHLAEESEDKMG